MELKNKLSVKTTVDTLALGGIAISLYLTYIKLSANAFVCGFGDCEKVTTSAYATVAGVPVALIGLAYYFTLLAFAVAYLDKRKERALRVLSMLTPFGFLASCYFVFLQLFVIHAICLYCLGSAATSTTVFVFGMVYLSLQKHYVQKEKTSVEETS